jgi:hypothetical protein
MLQKHLAENEPGSFRRISQPDSQAKPSGLSSPARFALKT